jgi:hypothetical protein
LDISVFVTVSHISEGKYKALLKKSRPLLKARFPGWEKNREKVINIGIIDQFYSVIKEQTTWLHFSKSRRGTPPICCGLSLMPAPAEEC